MKKRLSLIAAICLMACSAFCEKPQITDKRVREIKTQHYTLSIIHSEDKTNRNVIAKSLELILTDKQTLIKVIDENEDGFDKGKKETRRDRFEIYHTFGTGEDMSLSLEYNGEWRYKINGLLKRGNEILIKKEYDTATLNIIQEAVFCHYMLKPGRLGGELYKEIMHSEESGTPPELPYFELKGMLCEFERYIPQIKPKESNGNLFLTFGVKCSYLASDILKAREKARKEKQSEKQRAKKSWFFN